MEKKKLYMITIEDKDSTRLELCRSEKSIEGINNIMNDRRFLQLDGKCIAIKHIVMVEQI